MKTSSGLDALTRLASWGAAAFLVLGAAFLPDSAWGQDTASQATPSAAEAPKPKPRSARMAPPPLDEVRIVGLEKAIRESPGDLRLASEYRLLIILSEAYDRAISLFESLVEANPASAGALLSLGYALVDKIPSEGAITQVLLANTALGHFSSALEIEETWLGRYTRGNSYLYWPAIFGRTPLAIADLKQAIALAEGEERRPHHARPWVGLGDAHWRLDDVAKAREIWGEAALLFPENAELKARLEREGKALDTYLDAQFDANNRVDTDLSILWEAP